MPLTCYAKLNFHFSELRSLLPRHDTNILIFTDSMHFCNKNMPFHTKNMGINYALSSPGHAPDHRNLLQKFHPRDYILTIVPCMLGLGFILPTFHDVYSVASVTLLDDHGTLV